MRQITTIVLAAVSLACHTHCACAGDGCAEASHERVHAEVSLVRWEVGPNGIALQYKITNKSPQDIWVCDDMNAHGKWHREVVLAEDAHTLILRKRLDAPADPIPSVGRLGLPGELPVGTYVRLESGAQHRESLSLPFPVSGQRILSYAHPTDGIVLVERLLLQVSFYSGDLPNAIRGVLADAESIGAGHSCDFVAVPGFGVLSAKGLWQLNSLNKTFDAATDRVVIPYALQKCFRVHLLQIHVGGVRIPYEETSNSSEIPRGIIKDIPSGNRKGDSLNVAADLRMRRYLPPLDGLLVDARVHIDCPSGQCLTGRWSCAPSVVHR